MNASGEFDTSTAIMVWVGIFGTFFAFFIAPILVLIYVLFWRAKKNLTALAGRLGFTVAPDYKGIYGQVGSRSVRIYKYKMQGFRYETKWAEIAVSVTAPEFYFSLRPANIQGRLLGRSDDHEIKVGDADFDHRWRVYSSQPETIKTVLLPKLRSQIDQSNARQGEFIFESGSIRYREPYAFDTGNMLTRFESIVGLMYDLAEAIDVAAEKYSPPPVNS